MDAVVANVAYTFLVRKVSGLILTSGANTQTSKVYLSI
jgi:hypothetical protein